MSRFGGGRVVSLPGSRGKQLISETVLGADAASVVLSSIPQVFRHLEVEFWGRNSSTQSLNLRLNGDTAANYDYQMLQGRGAAAAATETFGATLIAIGTVGDAGIHSANVVIRNYVASIWEKAVEAVCVSKVGVATSDMRFQQFAGFWRSAAPVTALTIFPVAGNLRAGSVVSLYGRL